MGKSMSGGKLKNPFGRDTVGFEERQNAREVLGPANTERQNREIVRPHYS